MAWVRKSVADDIKNKISEAVKEVLKESAMNMSSVMECMSTDEWADFIVDINSLLNEKEKTNISMVGDQWVDIQRDRLNKISQALGIIT